MAAIRVGIAGLGRSGWNIHALGLEGRSDYKVTAVADPLAERQKEAKDRFGCAAYADPQEMMKDPNVDVVVVATPSHTHVPLTLAALANGKHVVVEKPMAESPQQIDEMIAAAKKAGKLLTCYQPRRYSPDFLAVKQWIESGRLGQILVVRTSLHGYSRRADWQMLRKFGGGELSNTGPHPIDQILQLIGPGPYELFADLKHTVGAGDAEDHVMLSIKSASGVVGQVEVSRVWAIPQPLWVVIGTYGALVGDRKEMRVKWADPSQFTELQVDEGAAKERKYGTPENIEWNEEVVAVQGGRKEVDAFYDDLARTFNEGAPVPVDPMSIRPQIELISRARQQTGLL